MAGTGGPNPGRTPPHAAQAGATHNAEPKPFNPLDQSGPASFRSMSPMISRRAWQIQADEGVAPVQYRAASVRVENSASADQATDDASSTRHALPSRMLDTHHDPPVLTPKQQQGRARAGTLPSSWSNTPVAELFASGGDAQKSVGVASGLQGIGFSPIGGDFRPWTNAANPSDPWSGLAGSVPGTPSENAPVSILSGYLPPVSAIHRKTVGNAARPSSALLHQYEIPQDEGQFPSVGASHTSFLHGGSTSALGPSNPAAYERNPPSSSHLQQGHSDLRPRSGSTNVSTTSMAANAFGSSLMGSAWAERAGSLAASGRNSPASRRGSILASSGITGLTESASMGGASGDVSNTPSRSQGNSAAFTVQDGGDYEALTLADAKQANATRTEFIFGNQRHRASTLAAMPHGPLARARSNQDVASLDAAATAYPTERMSNLNVSNETFAEAAVSSFGTGRLRSGTVAALGGPGGRQRAERELLRMATAGKFSSLSGQELNALLSSLESMGGSNGGSSDSMARSGLYNGAPLEGFPYLDVNTPPSLSTRHSPVPTPRPSSQGDLETEVRSASFPQHHPSGLARQASLVNLQASNISTASRDPSNLLNQIPSRSLWIGNLRSAVTGQELMHVFAQYGAIESLRLLPDKECGFVNFVEMEDAIRAREDVLIRLQAKLENLGSGPGGTVRIGFGKVDGVHVHNTIQGPGPSNTFLNRSAYEAAEDDGTTQGLAGMSEGNAPTRALWVGSIPSNVTPATLLSVFQPFGPVESARVLTHKNCGFVNFERVEDAVRARKMLNGREVLGSEVGAMRIGFAKVPARNVEPGYGAGDAEAAADPYALMQGGASKQDLSTRSGMRIENHRSNLALNLLSGQHNRLAQQQSGSFVDSAVNAEPANQGAASQRGAVSSQAVRSTGLSSSSSIVPASDKGGVPLPAHMAPRADVTDWQLLMRELSQGDVDLEADVASMTQFRPMQTYYISVPLVSEITSGRRFETARLREARRGIESGQLTRAQCDQLGLEYLDSIVDLASDYIGNTLMQKFFETCSDQVKMEMLQRLAPHLAMIGCHKNGTWAAQKILDCTDDVEQVKLIAQHLRPYVPGLLLDSFGNYVVQCCLRWRGQNDFVFDAMVDRCWEIAQGRFGARSMRACLENGNVSLRQRKRVAIAVILNSVPLATSPNGSILLTWLLETSGLSRSYRLLAPRLSPHLVHLCTHKLASNTILRIITQKVEPSASQMLLSALFESAEDADEKLEEIVVDQVHGSQFITKVLASPTLDNGKREAYAMRIRGMLVRHNLVGVPAYRRLCEDLGLLAVPDPSTMQQQHPSSGPSPDVPAGEFAAAGGLPPFSRAGPPGMMDVRFAAAPHSTNPPFPAGLPHGQVRRGMQQDPVWRMQ